MATTTTRTLMTKPADGETGWGSAVNANFDKLDVAPGVGHLYPRAQSSPNMTLAIAPGVVFTGTTPIYFAGGNTPSFTAPVGNPRIDLVYLNSSGVVVILQGTAAGSPVPPTYPSSVIPIAEVYLRPSTTVIHNTDQGSHGYIYRDVRSAMQSPGGAGGTSGVHATGSGDITGSVELEPGTAMDLDQSGQKITFNNQGVWGLGVDGSPAMGNKNIFLVPGAGIALSQDLPSGEITIDSTSPPALSNPMTTQGDLIYAGLGGLPTRLAPGTAGHVLTMSGGVPQWSATAAGKRAASRTVAAVNSVATSQSGADYLCDGVSDQVQINQAITDITSVGGSVVLLEGEYTVDGQISVPSNVRIEGRGAKLKIKNAHNTSINVINIGNTVTNVELVGLWIDGNKANNSAGTQHGIAVGSGGLNIVIDRCWVQNVRDDCVRLGTSTSARIQNSYLTGATLEGVNLQQASQVIVANCLIAANNNGLYLVNASGCVATGNIIYSNLNRNIFIGSGGSDNLFSGNRIYAATWEGVYVQQGNRNLFVGNEFFQNGVGTNNTYANFRVGTSASATVIMSNSFFKGIAGNLSKYGIWIEAGAVNTTAYPNAYPDGGGSTDDILDSGTSSSLGPDVEVQRSNSFVIAATDASTDQKNGADYICDGTADNVEWQAALDLIHTAGGGSILAVGSTFTFAVPVQVGHDTSIQGDSTGTTIRWANSSGNNIGLFEKRTALSSIDNFSLIHVTLDGNKSNQTNTNQYGVNLTNFNYPRLERVNAINFKGHGLNLSSPVQPFLLECRTQSNDSDGIHILGGQYGRIIGCYSASNGVNGFDYDLTDYTSIINCVAYDNTAEGIRATTCVNLSFLGCTVRRNGASATTDGILLNGCLSCNLTGCYVALHDRAVLINNACTGIVVSACVLDSHCGAEIDGSFQCRIVASHILAGSAQAVILTGGFDHVVENNFIYGGTVDGVLASACSNARIAHNHFYDCDRYGVYLSSTAHNTLIAYNQFYTNVDAAIDMTSSDNVTITGNEIYDGEGYGINLHAGCDNTRINSNRIVGCEDGGIYIQLSATHLQIHDNYLHACGRADYLTAGFGILVSSSTGPSIQGNTALACYGNGIHLFACDDAKVDGNKSQNNHQHGILLDSCSQSEVQNNRVEGNGQRTNVTYDNVQLVSCTTVKLGSNTIRVSTNTNKPRYGLSISTGNTDISLLTASDWLGGGQTADLNNAVSSAVRLLGGFLGFVDLYLPPVASSWTQVNFGSATVTNVAGGVALSVPGDATTFNWRGLFVTMPAAPFTLEACIVVDSHFEGTMRTGVVLRNSSSGLLVSSDVCYHNSEFHVDKWNSPTGVSALNSTAFNTGGSAYRHHSQVWFRLQDNNTNRIFSTSADGRTWRQHFSEGRTVFVTPNQIGWWANTGIAKVLNATLISWRLY